MSVQKKHAKDGLVVFAMNRGPGTNGALGRVARMKKWNFPLYNNGTIQNYELKANPQIFIFDHTGKLCYDPKYGIDFEKKAADYASKAPDFLVGDREFEHFGAESRAIAKRNNVGGTYADLEAKGKEAEGKAKEEAEFLLGRLKWYAEWLNARAKRNLEDGFPSDALAVLGELAKVYRGHPVGEKADAEAARLKADKGFKDEQSAERGVKAVEDLFYKIKPKGDGDDHAKWVKRYGRYIKSLEGKFKSFEKKFNNTKVYERVKKLVSELGIG